MRKRHTTRYRGIRYRLLDEARPDGPRRYVVTYTDRTGTVRTRTMPIGATLEDARTLQSNLNVRKAQGDSLVPVKTTVTEALDHYLNARRPGLSQKTYEDYLYGCGVIKAAVGNLRLTALTPGDCAALISQLRDEGKMGATIKKILTPFQGALKVAVREGWIQSNPMDKLLAHERPTDDSRDMRSLTPTEIEVLLRHASTDRWKTLFALLTFTGLRISEALRLTWDDVDRDTLVVREAKTDAGRMRVVMLIPRLNMMMTKHRLSQPPGTAYVFANRDGLPVSRREALRALRAAEKRAGIPQYTLHELRHTFASMLISQGESVVLVADQMGHADPGITLKTYARLFDAQKNIGAARDKLQAAMGGGA